MFMMFANSVLVLYYELAQGCPHLLFGPDQVGFESNPIVIILTDWSSLKKFRHYPTHGWTVLNCLINVKALTMIILATSC